MVARLLERNTPTESGLHRAPPLRCLVAARSGDDEASATARATEAAARRPGGRIRGGGRGTEARARGGTYRARPRARTTARVRGDESGRGDGETVSSRRDRRSVCRLPARVRTTPRRRRRRVTLAGARGKDDGETERPRVRSGGIPRASEPRGWWTDTPPYSLERRGAVLHVAVLTASPPSRGGGAGNPGAGAGRRRAGGADQSRRHQSRHRSRRGRVEDTHRRRGRLLQRVERRVRIFRGSPSAAISATATRSRGVRDRSARVRTQPRGPRSFGGDQDRRGTPRARRSRASLRARARVRVARARPFAPRRGSRGGRSGETETERARRSPTRFARSWARPGSGSRFEPAWTYPAGPVSGRVRSSVSHLARDARAEHGRAWTPGDAESGAGAARWAGRSAIVPHPESKHADEASRARAEAGAEAATEARESVSWPSARVAFNAVLAVEQLMTTGGGWQDQIGGALEGARLTVSVPGDFDAGKGTAEARPNVTRTSPRTSPRATSLLLSVTSRVRTAGGGASPSRAAFLSRHVACVFTGACRLAATVARGVVDAWQRRAVGVEDALRACAAVGAEMTDALDRLGALPNDSFVGVGSEAARAELDALGNALERHKAMQEKLWPSITSPTVRALYDAVAPLARGVTSAAPATEDTSSCSRGGKDTGGRGGGGGGRRRGAGGEGRAGADDAGGWGAKDGGGRGDGTEQAAANGVMRRG